MRLPTVRGRFVRCVMGKPYAGEDWEQLAKERKKADEEKKTEKFSKAFQAYLDSVEEEKKKQNSPPLVAA